MGKSSNDILTQHFLLYIMHIQNARKNINRDFDKQLAQVSITDNYRSGIGYLFVRKINFPKNLQNHIQ